MLIRAIRRLSTRTPVFSRFYNIIESSSTNDKQQILEQVSHALRKERNALPVNSLHDLIQHRANEEPKKEALFFAGNKINECQILTFDDVYQQTCRWSNALSGKEFGLEKGQTVLVILPGSAQERIFLQLACSQSGLIFSLYGEKDLTVDGIREIIQKLAVACIVTNTDNFEIVHKATLNPIRPLKKGLITASSADEPLPISWSNITRSVNNAQSKYEKPVHVDRHTPVVRSLSTNKKVIQYSLENFNLRLFLTALWLNQHKAPRLIWMNNSNSIMSMAPWLLGSSIFYKETKDFQGLLNTLESHPIEALCTTSTNYQMIENQQQEKKENETQLQQLFSFEPNNPNVKYLWHSLTNLDIQDDYADFNNESILKYFPDYIQEKQNHTIWNRNHSSENVLYSARII